MSFLLRTLALLTLLLGAVQAAPLEVLQMEKSRLNFTYRQMGVALEGRFPRFSGQMNFDPAKPQAARASLEIDLRAVDAGNDEANGLLQTRPWFNTKAEPFARFLSSSVRGLGGNRYELLGKLSIKGQSRDISVPFTFSQEGKAGIFDGSFKFNRLDFNVGDGEWRDTDTLGNEIQVRFRLVYRQK